MTAPSERALGQFGVDPADLELLPGGQGTTWSTGPLLLKPADDPSAAAWIAESTASLVPGEYRLAQPVRTRLGAWVIDGWCAWWRIAGEHGSVGRWAEILPVARALHRDLSSLSRPSFLDHRDDPWAIADRVAWGEQDHPTRDAALGELLSRCSTLRVDEGLSSQIIHGDLCGNVLFEQGQPPAVIDLSPYWRPAEYALALTAVDALAWYSAPPNVLDDLADVPTLASLLARAAMFRLITADLMTESGQCDDAQQAAAEFRPVIDLISALPSPR